MAHAAARIGNVAEETGDELHMQVENSLSCHGAAIDADVIAIRSVTLFNNCLRRIHSADEVILLLSTSLEPRGNMASRY